MNLANKLLVVITCVILIMFSNPAAALVNPLVVEKLEISVWPEYDQPAVLVIYSGQLTNQLHLPYDGSVFFNIPKSAQLELVCEAELGLQTVIYTMEEYEDYKQVSWQVTKPIEPGGTLPFLIEYYYDPLENKKDSSEKSFQFSFTPSYHMEQLIWDVKEPFDCCNFQVTPELQVVGQDNNKFITYQLEETQIKQGEVQHLQINYVRESLRPSIDRETATVSGMGEEILIPQVKESNKGLALATVVLFLGLYSFLAMQAMKKD